MGGTAVPRRHLPYALPKSALPADEPDGAHAAREPTELAWSSPFPPSLAFMEELWRAEPAAPLLRLMTRTCDVRRRQRAGTVQVPSVRPQNDADTIANAASHLPYNVPVRPGDFWAERTGVRASRSPENP